MVLLCFGYGYVAQRLARHVPYPLIGTSRSGQGGTYRYADGVMDDALAALLPSATHILISTPPHAQEAELMHRIRREAKRCRWLGYLSSTAVYGDANGNWVTETTQANPHDARGQARLASEQVWAEARAHIFRLAGIYGPGRSAFDAIREGRAQRIDKPGHVFSRVHVDDIARALVCSMRSPTPGAIYNLADALPAPYAEVIAYASGLLGFTPPPLLAFETVTLSPMQQHFYAASRRVSAVKIKQYHGFKFLYPTYRDGLAAILQEG